MLNKKGSKADPCSKPIKMWPQFVKEKNSFSAVSSFVLKNSKLV